MEYVGKSFPDQKHEGRVQQHVCRGGGGENTPDARREGSGGCARRRSRVNVGSASQDGRSVSVEEERGIRAFAHNFSGASFGVIPSAKTTTVYL